MSFSAEDINMVLGFLSLMGNCVVWLSQWTVQKVAPIEKERIGSHALPHRSFSVLDEPPPYSSRFCNCRGYEQCLQNIDNVSRAPPCGWFCVPVC